MGFGNIGIWQLLIVLAIVVVLFGTKRVRSLGGDLGAALKSFRSAVRDDEDDKGGDTAQRTLRHDEEASGQERDPSERRERV